VVVTDILDKPLAFARSLGADHTVNVAVGPDALAGYEANTGSCATTHNPERNDRWAGRAIRLIPPATFAMLCYSRGGPVKRMP
jgi:L-idonate 5-dehydrogenase